MTSYVTVTRVDPVENEHAAFAVWVLDNGKERIWLYANDPESFPVGKRFQI
jgi:hypothetical protein